MSSGQIDIKSLTLSFRRKDGVFTQTENIREKFGKCHLVHTSPDSVAAISDCGDSGKIRYFN